MLTNIEFYNETIHGSAFTGTPASYLHGNVGDRCKVVIEIQTELSTESEPGAEFAINASTTTITRNGGSFFDEGFFPGQTVKFTEIGGTSQTITATLDFVTDSYMTYTVVSGSLSTNTYPDGSSTGNLNLIVTGDITSLVHKFGVVGNDDPTDYKSPYNGATQEFKVTGLSVGSTATGTYKNGPQSDESLTVEYISNTNGVHVLEISHIFKITPFYLDEYKADLEDGTIPSFLSGSASQKYVFYDELRFDINNPNNKLVEQFDRYKGSTGWYGEELDNNNPEFEITGVTYTNTATGETIDTIKPDVLTRIVLTVEGTFNSTTGFVSTIATAKGSDVYQYSQNDFEGTFIWSSLYTVGQTRVLGSGVMKKMDVVYVSGTEATITIEVQYSSTQIARIDPENDKYILFISIADQSLSLPNSNKCTLLAAYQLYEYEGFLNIPDLLTWTNAEVYSHELDVSATGKTSVNGWPKDGLQISWAASLASDATIAGLKYGTCAYNGTNLFTINEYQAPLGNPTVDSNGVQYFNVETTRGFKLDSADPFNRVYLSTTSSSPFEVEGRCGIKIGWQDWIKNDNVDTIFVDTTMPNNNLNQLASNYSGQGYSLYAFVIAEVSYQGGLATQYVKLINMDAYPYDEDFDNPPQWSAETKIYDTNGSETGAIDTNGYNTVEVVLTPVGGDTTIYSDLVGIIRLEKENHAGEEIHELSSERESYSGNPLVPNSGQTALEITDSGATITLSCRVDGRLLQPGSNYIINGRLYHLYTNDNTPIFSFDTVVYAGSGVFNIPITAKDWFGNSLGTNKQVNIRVEIDSTPIEYITGLTGADISTFTTSAPSANSIVSFSTGIIADSGTVVFNKKAWAEQNGYTNTDAKEIYLYSTATDRGDTSSEDTEIVPIESTPGTGEPRDIDYIDSDNRVFADYSKGVRLHTDTYTELIGTLSNCIDVAIDRYPSTDQIYGIANADPKIYLWDNTNRRDLGFNGVPKTSGTLSWNPCFIYVDNTHQSNGYSEMWLCKDAFDSNLILRYYDASNVWINVDLSSRIPASTKVKSVVMDTNGVLWCLGEKSGSGNLVFKLVLSGGRYVAANWTATTICADNGAGFSGGNVATAQFSGNCTKIIIMGYDTTLLASSGTNPMLLISDFGNDCYRLLNKPGVNWEVDADPLYCGTNGTNTFTFGTASIEVGKVRGMVYDGTKFWGTGEDSTTWQIFSIENYGNAVTQFSESVFGSTSNSYSERVAF